MIPEKVVKLKKKYIFYRTASIVLCAALLCSASFSIFLFIHQSEEPLNPGGEPIESTSVDTSNDVSTEPEESVGGTEAVTEDPRIDEFESQIASYEEKIRELEDLVIKYGDAASSNFGAQAQNFEKLLDIIDPANRPKHVDVKTETDADGNETETKTYSDSKIAFCYTDLTTGYSFSYNGDDVMYSASLIKAPYIYAVLKSVADFEYNKLNFAEDGFPLYAEDGTPLFEGSHPNLNEDGSIKYLKGEEKYDLSRTWTYDSKTMYNEGSGKIQDKKDGFSLTYLELVQYALKYSDNIAFAQIKKLFGTAEYDAIAKELEISGTSKGFMQLSAVDCSKFLSKIHEFCESDTKYGAAMKEALSKTSHEVLIPTAVSPTPCIHKYGWDEDAYHDMGIVYDTAPFSLVIMTDLDTYSGTNNAFINNITKTILNIHRDFHQTEV